MVAVEEKDWGNAAEPAGGTVSPPKPATFYSRNHGGSHKERTGGVRSEKKKKSM